MGSAWSFQQELLLSVTIPVLWAEGFAFWQLPRPERRALLRAVEMLS
jgi:hypothetical protein